MNPPRNNKPIYRAPNNINKLRFTLNIVYCGIWASFIRWIDSARIIHRCGRNAEIGEPEKTLRLKGYTGPPTIWTFVFGMLAGIQSDDAYPEVHNHGPICDSSVYVLRM